MLKIILLKILFFYLLLYIFVYTTRSCTTRIYLGIVEGTIWFLLLHFVDCLLMAMYFVHTVLIVLLQLSSIHSSDMMHYSSYAVL